MAPKNTPGETARLPAKAQRSATPRGEARAPSQRIDKDKLRARLRMIGDEYVYYMLDDAIDLLPEGKLVSLVKKYIRLDDLRPDTVEGTSLLDRVQRFETESLAGKYYQAFDVNWKNCTKKSAGTEAERQELWRALDLVKASLDRELHPDGYNVGFNAGDAAGQTVMHFHLHVIPRYRGDVADPVGGVRHVIPSKGNYLRGPDERA